MEGTAAMKYVRFHVGASHCLLQRYTAFRWRYSSIANLYGQSTSNSHQAGVYDLFVTQQLSSILILDPWSLANEFTWLS